MIKNLSKVISIGLLSAMITAPVFAQDVPDPGHPRVNEVDQRLQNQQNRVNAGVADGQITPNQAAHDEARDAKVANQENKDMAKHNGHLTKREQRHLNKKLNKNSKHIKAQRATPPAQ